MSTILIAEDESEVRDYLGLALTCHGYDVEFAQDGEEAVGLLKRRVDHVSVLLLDLMMPRKDGFQTLREVHQCWPQLPVITLSGSCSPSDVASVMKGGALDFLAKPVAHSDLLKAIRSAVESRSSSQPPAVPLGFASSGGESWPQRVEMLLMRMSSSDVPVLLRGETGVGKEDLARKIHSSSRRSGRPFLKLNCAALPSELVESELFGYEKGAFTGAFKTTIGKFEMADKGTILLDEIGDMDVKLQAKLLQVLQDQEFLRLGAKNMSRVDVRVMAATHCDLEKAIANGRFREDLYYRLNILGISVPPLRERKEEIRTLAEHFVRKYASSDPPELPSSLLQEFFRYDWPGNVRELENVVRRFLIYGSVEPIAAELRRKATSDSAATPDIPAVRTPKNPVPVIEHGKESDDAEHGKEGGGSGQLSSALAHVDEARRKAEIETILSALNTTFWNRKQAAKLLKIDYKALLYKMRKLGIGERPTD